MGLRWLEPLTVEQVEVIISGLSPALVGTKIIQLSDFHYDGNSLSEQLLTEAIRVSNREEPTLVVLTGDYITKEASQIQALAQQLKRLNSCNGIYACLGNHDSFNPDVKLQVINALEAVGICVLVNAIATPLGQDLPLVGLGDIRVGEFQPKPVFSQLSPKTPRIVLSHNPDTAALLQPWRVDLQLSGHTHGGQIILPRLGPVPQLLKQIRQLVPGHWPKRIPFLGKCSGLVKNWQWNQGLHHLDHNQLYVNRGLGSYFPGRFNCPPEVTVITLV